jgi:carboxypeptidase C (cathepsin A)
MKRLLTAMVCLCLGISQPLLAQNRANNPDQPGTPARGRGGEAAATSAAIAPIVDETPSVTHHKIDVNGKTLAYTATVQQMPIKDANGDTEAHICYFAYTLDGADPAKRPLSFCFNGGPGSASIWVHMGAMGPRSPLLKDDGDMPPPPFQIIDNESTWLDESDLVFIDPVGTGYSRAKSTEVARRMNGVQGDIASVAEFVRMYITRNDRWMSPLFIAGESYGTFRAAGLAGNLIDQGIAVNGVTLMSTILNYGTSVRSGLINNTPYALFLPTYTADAFYHRKLPADLQKDLNATLKEVEAWTMTSYLEALNKGDAMTADERKATLDKLARYTGLSTAYLDNSDLRLDVAHFTRELLRDQKLTIGRLDGRLIGPSPLNADGTAEFDPSSTLTRPPFQAAFMQYIRNELSFKTDMLYYVSGGIMPWEYDVQNGYADTTQALRNAFAKNPHLKVMVCCGYFDLATPYFAAQYTLNHMGIQADAQKNISWQYYSAGHMMYIDKACHAKLKTDIANFIHSCLPKS